MSDQKLKFGAMVCGEHFICWPTPGDDSGHGGYLGTQRLLTKTGELTAVNGRGIESSMNAKMDVIKVADDRASAARSAVQVFMGLVDVIRDRRAAAAFLREIADEIESVT